MCFGYRAPSTRVTVSSVQNVDSTDAMNRIEIEVYQGEVQADHNMLPMPIEVQDDGGGDVEP